MAEVYLQLGPNTLQTRAVIDLLEQARGCSMPRIPVFTNCLLIRASPLCLLTDEHPALLLLICILCVSRLRVCMNILLTSLLLLTVHEFG